MPIRSKRKKSCLNYCFLREYSALPFAVNMAAVILFMPKITYCHGEITNYSMGIPVYTCYIMVAVYMLGSVILLICGRKNMGYNKLITITTCIVAALAVTVYQMIHPQALLTSLVSVFVIIGAYLNMENPLLQKLRAHNKEMVMGFATLVENRDGSTGGHIRRTTTYSVCFEDSYFEVGIGQRVSEYRFSKRNFNFFLCDN